MQTIEQLENIISKLKDESTRWDAILELKIFDASKHIFYLINLLNDSDWIIRWCVAEKLGDINNPQTILPLISILSDTDPHVRKTAAKALSKFGKAAVPGLVLQFQNLNPHVRKLVSKVLFDMGENIIPDLEKNLSNQNWIVSNRIAHLIWSIGGYEAESALIRSLEIKDVQKNVLVFLGKSDSQRILAEIFKYYSIPRLRIAIITALSCIGDKAFLYLTKKLNSNDIETAKQSARILVKTGSQALPYLLASLKKEENKKKRLIKVYNKIIHDKGGPPLADVAKEDSVLRKILDKL
jgi:HEAT repeat protein